MKEIKTTNGYSVLVDDCDFEWLSKFKWRAQKDGKTFYAVRMDTVNDKKTCVRMHRQIMGFPPFIIDHRNRNGLDNQRGNIRRATNSQNQANSTGHLDSSSPHKGLWWSESRKRWLARITANGKRIHIGYFRQLSEAVDAYRDAVKYYFGEFAP